jgi:hypothetical protein
MPNIDELKTNKSSGFVPTLKQLSQEEEPTLPPRMSAGISQGQSTVSYNGGKRSNAVKSGGMSFAKKPKMPAKEDRVEADFSSLPKTRLDETAGVDLRTSIEDDIFHEGGPFDQYLENKKKEYQEDMEKYEQALEAKKLEDEEKAELENDPDNGKILEFDNSDRSDVDTNITQTQS